MTNATAQRIAAVLGGLAVALGAFGAHGLKRTLADHGMVATWEKAVFYHFIHAVVLFVLAQQAPLRRVPRLSFLAGILLFSGSLYLYCLLHLPWLAMITPLGGASFIVGWVCLAIKPNGPSAT